MTKNKVKKFILGSETLNEQEHATILCGLRMVQEYIRRYGKARLEQTYDHFTDVSALPIDEIDNVCERLNIAYDIVLVDKDTALHEG